MSRIADQVTAVSARFPERTIFTRFQPPPSADQMPGMWRSYYEKWPMMTAARMDPGLIDLIYPLQSLVPPARILNKRTYSPWITGRLERALALEKVETVVVTGGETDVCVMATVLGAIDLGYKVIVLKDGVYSSLDETHDAWLPSEIHRGTLAEPSSCHSVWTPTRRKEPPADSATGPDLAIGRL
ncbi:cysteine hydrolase (plasmid) [Ensifer adhaerens]|uniref:cysteine hydrolase n=1 Tax=Ensifer adhaerens TaxID=106592 RepID=UPI002E2D1C2B|nr:cysteine hydrolase [Ensifer adhaerens]UAX98160.1 cysteine hydrolase [Ensifer adhaerens]UAY05542.1 cysteine hydrolase [Ensifer adhaerens]UAY12920.1 cysteine hydrolase [Ensifer adhaerens]